MKKAIFFLISLVFFCSISYAGGPTTALPVKEVEKPKKVVVAYAYEDFNKIEKHFTCGLGLGGNPMFGFVEKDGFGYPQCEYGFTWVLGFGYTWVSGQPTERQIKDALEAISVKKGALVNEKDVPSLVREETGIKSLQYVTAGTALLVLPINIEMGTMWILNDNTRTRLGFGLPTLISFGINFDF